jgi:hypothetical protein
MRAVFRNWRRNCPSAGSNDHCDNWGKTNPKTQAAFAPYVALREKYPHSTLKPGDTIPVKGLQVNIVAAAGDSMPGRCWERASRIRSAPATKLCRPIREKMRAPSP